MTRYERLIAEILARADKLNDQSATEVLKLIAQLQDDTTKAIAKAAAGSFSARHLKTVRAGLGKAADAFLERYGQTFPDLYETAWSLGIDLADRPLGKIAGLVPRTTLEVLVGYSADLIREVSAAAISKTNAIVAQATLGIITPGDAIERVAGELPGRSVFPSLRARAEAIVRTESGRVLSVAHEARLAQQAQVIPRLAKRWVTAGDARVRGTHLAAGGQVVPADGRFVVGGYTALYPRDPSLPASESVMCRCWSVPVVPAELLEG